MPGKYKERVKRVNVRPFPNIVYFIVTSDTNATLKRRWPSVKPSPLAYATTLSGGQYIYVILPVDCGIGAIAHEIVHVVKAVMDCAGVEFEEEVWAYHTQELVETAAKFVYKKGNHQWREYDANKKRSVLSGRKARKVVK